MTTYHFSSLRKNASLQAVAKAARKKADHTKAEYKRFHAIIAPLKHNATTEQLGYLRRLNSEWCEQDALANHLSRLAGIEA